jgi:signal transduction histidine kinase
VIKGIIFFFLLMLSSLNNWAGDLSCFDVSKGFKGKYFHKSVLIYKDCKQLDARDVSKTKIDLYDSMQSANLSVTIAEQNCFFWARFRLVNTSSKLQRIFYTSGSVATYTIYYIKADSTVAEFDSPKKGNYTVLEINSGDTLDFLVRNALLGSGTSQFIYPYLVDIISKVEEDPDLILSANKDPFFYFLIVFIGMTGMLAIYLLISYFHIRDKSFLYYSLNIFCIVILVAVRIFYREAPNSEADFYQTFVGPMMQILSHLFYFLFASHFLDLEKLLPKLYRFFQYTVLFLIVYIISDLILFLKGDNIVMRMQLFFWVRILLLLIAFGSIIYANRKPTFLLRLFAIGTFLMVLSATISFVLSYNNTAGYNGLWSVPLFYFLLGYLIDNLFFTVCLGYKNRQEQRARLLLEKTLLTERANEREKSLRLVMDTQEQERIRMAEDLHDELGSGLSTIRFMIEARKLKGETLPAQEVQFISAKAAEIISNMRQIIWTVNPEHDNLADLLHYMKRYTSEYLDSNKIEWGFKMPDKIDSRGLPPGLRRNLFAILKEALHNVVKHAFAGSAGVFIELDADSTGQLNCKMVICDNGKGMLENNGTAEGNGLKNMAKRMKEVGGTFKIYKGWDNVYTGNVVELQFLIAWYNKS